MYTLGHRLANNELVTLSQSDFRTHMYVLGQTGSGKTNFLESLMQQSDGFCYIDKHGDSAKRIADSASRPIIYWKPADLSHTIALNPLQNVHPDERWKVAAEIVSTFSDIWNLGTETPRLLYYLRASIRLLLDNAGTTLVDIRRVLSDGSYRSRLLRHCVDIENRQTWEEFNMKRDQQQAIEISSLQNKVAALADPLPLRRVLGQKTSTINLRRIIDTGVPLILDLSEMGDEPAHLLGALVISQFSLAAEARAHEFLEDARRDYTLFVDEFQNFCSRTAPKILSEARKRRLSLCIAHQYVSQLDEDIRDGILGNVGTVVSFRVGAQDAPIIAKAIGAPESELRDLPRGQAWVAGAAGRRAAPGAPCQNVVGGIVYGKPGGREAEYAGELLAHGEAEAATPRSAVVEAGGGGLGLIPLVELTKMRGNSTCPPILWINRWKNGLATLLAI
jgi:hypothetical protein